MRKAVFLATILAVLALAVGAIGDPCIRLKYATFDPLAGLPPISADLQNSPAQGEPSHYLVQFTGPVDASWEQSLNSLGAEVLDYIPDFAFIVEMTPEVAAQASHLDHVRWVGPFHPAYRISPELLNPTGPMKVGVRLFPGRARAALASEIGRLGGTVERGESGTGGESVRAMVPARIIRQIARRAEVSWIEPEIEHKLSNSIARGLMDVPDVWSGIGLYGSGEIVAVCDTGLDTGNTSTIAADFSGRLIKTYALGRTNAWDDPDGHGTHVAGSVLGSGVLSGSSPSSHNYTNSFAGTAPEAQLVFQSILSNDGKLGKIPADLNQLFQPTYDDGARIHTNSWGAAYDGVYTTDAHNVDQFVWDHKDMTILFSAGNDGKDTNINGVVDTGSVESPGTAKNCITVGATESNRTSDGVQTTYGYNWAAKFPVDPIFSDRLSNNPSGMAAFSSRGPCTDGRIKPDICAPGTNIISCRSHASGAGTLWGVYNSSYLYCGGTSMAAPLTAGAAALIRQFYRTQKAITPSAALIKATLINGAKDCYPGQYGTGAYLEIPARPNNVEGWGLVDLANSVKPSGLRDVRFVDNSTGLYTNGSATYTYTVTASTDPVRVTLVWSDYPASTSASTALVNDLDLTVTLPNGTVRSGNGATDRINNTEGVDVSSPATGTYTVTVRAYNVPHGPQPFALVFSGDMLTAPPIASITLPANGTTLAGPVSISGTASGTSFLQYTLEYGAGTVPVTYFPIGTPQTTPVTNGLLYTWNTSGLANGTYTVRLSAQNSASTTRAYTTVNVLQTSLSQIKFGQNTPSVTLTGKVVSAGKSEFGTFMYVQEPDRSSGLRINTGSLQTNAVIGSVVTVTGTLDSASGERVVTSPTITPTGSTTNPRPVAMLNKMVGGDWLNTNTPGVTGGAGLNNICLLVNTWGRVTYIGTDYFYMDDGCRLDDGSGRTGIKVYTGSLVKPTSTSQYAVVTGISSTEINGTTTRRLLRPRLQTDLVYH